MGPMVAASQFINKVQQSVPEFKDEMNLRLRCTLKGSLAFTGRGHGTDKALILGLHGYTPEEVAYQDVDSLIRELIQKTFIEMNPIHIGFNPTENLIFDTGEALPQHPNGMIFELINSVGDVLFSRTCFSIGGGFVSSLEEIKQKAPPPETHAECTFPFGFDSAAAMLRMSAESRLCIADMKRQNEKEQTNEALLNDGLDAIWQAMSLCVKNGLESDGELPGGLGLKRRAKGLLDQLQNNPATATVNDWLCAYAMAVNEENAAGHLVVTAPTNGAAGVIPAILYYFVHHQNGTREQIHDFLLTAAAIGGIIKHRSSISGAEVGCQGEIGSASAMAAAGLCAVKGGTPQQIENAAEIALEHHLGMTCDPIRGLVQVPCIERNGFGAIKAFTAASLALRGSGQHLMSLDNCIAAMKQTGQEMSEKFKETSLGGLAVSVIEC